MHIKAVPPLARVDAAKDFDYIESDIPEGMSCSMYQRARLRARRRFWRRLFK